MAKVLNVFMHSQFYLAQVLGTRKQSLIRFIRLTIHQRGVMAVQVSGWQLSNSFLMPITPISVLVFSALMGSLWLATVPLTSGLVAHLYGVRYMGTLYGFVFLSHQIGSFLGVWLGGRLYDATGDYTAVWWIGVAIGAFSAIIHLPIKEERRVLPQAA